MLRQGTLSKTLPEGRRSEQRTRPATTLINVKGSDCPPWRCIKKKTHGGPNKQGESLSHEAPNEGQAGERLYPSAVPLGFINRELQRTSTREVVYTSAVPLGFFINCKMTTTSD